MKQPSSEPIWTKDFILVVLVNLLIFTVFYSYITVLPVYVLDGMDGTESQAGFVTSVFLLAAIILRPLSGMIIDRFGQKRIAIISVTLFTFSAFLYVFIDNFYMLLALRFFQGIWFSIITTVTGAIAANIIPKNRRGEGLGYFVMSMNLAVVIGPFIGLNLIGKVSFSNLFLLFSIFALVSIFCCLPLKVKEVKGSTSFAFTLSNMFEKKALPIAIVGLSISFWYSSVISFISVYAHSLNLMDASGYFFLCFAATMIISRPFTGRLFDRVGPGIVIYPSILLFSIGLLMLAFTSSSVMLLLSGAVIGLGYGTLLPCMQTIAIQSSPANRSGYAIATFFTFFDTGIATGSYILGILVTFSGFSNLYLLASIFVLISLYLYPWSRRKSKSGANNPASAIQ
ncbi:MFS transporter [Bacillus gobiensis]|uniref:MFS transporter n=1 Tax=Bacillus gobiensis TaxID=1441095 RepID=UPI003D2097EE